MLFSRTAASVAKMTAAEREKSFDCFFLFLFLFYLPCVGMKKACTAKNGHCPVVVLSIHVTPPYNHLRLFFSCYLRHPLLFHFLVLALLTDHRISSLSLLPITTSAEQTLIELILCDISFALSLSLSFTCNKLVFDTQSVSQLVCVFIFTLASSLFN